MSEKCESCNGCGWVETGSIPTHGYTRPNPCYPCGGTGFKNGSPIPPFAEQQTFIHYDGRHSSTASGFCSECKGPFWIGSDSNGNLSVDNCPCGKNKVENITISLRENESYWIN